MQADARPTGSCSWSAPLAGPGAKEEFFRARHGTGSYFLIFPTHTLTIYNQCCR